MWPPIGLVRFGSAAPPDAARARDFWRPRAADRPLLHRAFPPSPVGPGRLRHSATSAAARSRSGTTSTRASSALGNPLTPSSQLDVLSPDPQPPEATIAGDLTHLPRSPMTPSTASSARRRCCSSTTCGQRSRRSTASSSRVACCSRRSRASARCAGRTQLWGDFWRFTSLSAERLFAERFGAADVTVESYGNVSPRPRFCTAWAGGAQAGGARSPRPGLRAHHRRPRDQAAPRLSSSRSSLDRRGRDRRIASTSASVQLAPTSTRAHRRARVHVAERRPSTSLDSSTGPPPAGSSASGAGRARSTGQPRDRWRVQAGLTQYSSSRRLAKASRSPRT